MKKVRLDTAAKAARIRVLLVEDETIVREAIGALLQQAAGIMVVGEAVTAAEAVRQVRRCKPDMILLDLRLPDQPGTAVIQALLQAAPAARILVLTGFAEAHEVAAAFRAGAVGCVLKTQAVLELVQAIHAADQGQAMLHPTIARRLLDALHHPPKPLLAKQPLSKTEQCVLALVAQGLADKEIARTLGVTPTTARIHVGHILSKLQLTNRTQAMRYALQQGVVTLSTLQLPQSDQRPSHAW